MSMVYAERLAELDFYPLWSALPDLTRTVDPFDYPQRLAVYKLLMDATNQRGVFGHENEFNVFWGYVFQVDWRWRSGRLHLAHTPPGRIDPNSMWGYGNYSLSIIPLIAAMQMGLTPEREILAPYVDSAVEYACGVGKAGPFQIPAAFQEAARAWQQFFRLMQRIESGGNLEPLRFELWQAHRRSLIAAEAGIRLLVERHSSRSELDFLIGWVRMVDFLGTAAWRTNLLFMLENGVGMLPERMLSDGDLWGHILDMDDQVRSNIRNIIGLTHQSRLRFGFNLWLWKRAMRTRQARDEVLPMLDATFNPSPQNIHQRRKLLRYMLGL